MPVHPDAAAGNFDRLVYGGEWRPPRFMSAGPQNVTSFGNRVFAGAIRLR